MKFFYFTIIAGVLTLLFTATAVFSAGQSPPQIEIKEIDGVLHMYIPDRTAEEIFRPEQVTNKFVRYYVFFMGFVGISAFVMIVIAGIQYTTSAGNPAGINAAKEKIWNALFGLALAAGSYIILKLINPDLIEFKLGMHNPPIILQTKSPI